MDSQPRPTPHLALLEATAAMSSSSTKTAQYGSWKSPITSDLIVAQSISLSDVCLDGEDVYWLEGRPQEQGRYVVVRAGSDVQPTDITPLAYNARTRVHEYGAGSWTVHKRTVYFSNFADGGLYSQVPGLNEPRALTPGAPPSDGIDVPTGMVARRSADRAYLGSLRLVESLFVRCRNARSAGPGADGGGVWTAAMGVRHVDLRFRGAEADRLHLLPRGDRLPRLAQSGERNAHAGRDAVHRVRFAARYGRSRGVSRRRTRSSRQRRRTRSHVRSALRTEEGDRYSRSYRPTSWRLPHAGRKRGIPDQRRGNSLRPVLFAAQSRLCAGGGGAASASRQVPRRTDVGRLEHAQSGHSILDEPRHCGARRELPRKHRIRSSLPRPSAAQLGRHRCRRLRRRRTVPGSARASRRQAMRHQRRQRRRLHDSGGADLPRLLSRRSQLLRRERHRRARARHP